MKEFFESLGSSGLKTCYLAIGEFTKYATVVFLAVFILCYFIFKHKVPQKFDRFKVFSLGFAVGYAITTTLIISFFMIGRIVIKEEADINFYLIIGLSALCIAYAITLAITSTKSAKTFKICNIVFGVLIFAFVITLMFILPTVGEEYEPLSFSYYIFAGLFVVLLVVICLIDKTKVKKESFALSCAGITVALSFLLSYIKLFSLPQGGSITLGSMLPLIIFSYMFGAKRGIAVGAIYGLLQCIQSPQIYEPIQVLIDYPLAFGALGVAGMARNFKFLKQNAVAEFVVGATMACFLRYVAHFLSGYYVFSSWMMEGYTALTWSLVYNLYVIVDLAILLVVGILLFASKSFKKEVLCKFDNK